MIWVFRQGDKALEAKPQNMSSLGQSVSYFNLGFVYRFRTRLTFCMIFWSSFPLQRPDLHLLLFLLDQSYDKNNMAYIA
jgi:hypothetical protein